MRPTTFLRIALGFIIGGVSMTAQAINFPTIIGEAIAQSVEPYYTTGRIVYLSGTLGYQGSATVIGSRSSLTCAHVLFSTTNGLSTNMTFRIAQSNHSSRSVHSASKLFIFSGYEAKSAAKGEASNAAFQHDLGGLRFRGTPNVPKYASWSANPGLLNGNYFMMSLGYGGALHAPFTAGRVMLKSSPQSKGSFQPIRSAYWENYTYNIEPGMSGGPTYVYVGGQWLILGINVSGYTNYSGSGYRVIDAQAGNFISQHLSL